MTFKGYSDGFAVLYQEHTGERRPNPYKYNKAKRARNHANAIQRKIFCLTRVLKSGHACFFTATSAGRPGKITGREIDRLCTLLRNAHGLRAYYWVKELTKAGTEHLHFVASFEPGYRMAYWVGVKKGAVKLSLQWSAILEMPGAKNAVRFGWYRKKKRFFYLSKEFGGGYCAKYLSKPGQRVTGRRFSCSEQLQKFTAPVSYPLVWEDCHEKKLVMTAHGLRLVDFPNPQRFINGLPDIVLKKLVWRRVEADGFYVYLGRAKTESLPIATAEKIFNHIFTET